MKRIKLASKNRLKKNEVVSRTLKGLNKYNFESKRILLVIDDNTRATPVHLFSKELLRYFSKRDCPVVILIANGTHRRLNRKEMEKKLGINLRKFNISCFNHDSKDLSSLVRIGKINGRWIKLNKLVKESDVIIGVSSTVPHRVVGFSGSAKIICPGIADRKTISYIHWLSTKFEEQDILCKAYNPVRHFINKVPDLISTSLGKTCISINFVLIRNLPARLFVGSFDYTYKKSTECARKFFIRRVNRCDRILVQVPDRCLDFWQAAKAVYNCGRIVREGGELVVCGLLEESISKNHPEIVNFGYNSVKTVKHLVSKNMITDKLVASHMVRVSEYAEKIRIILSSPNISEKLCKKAHLGYLSPRNIKLKDYEYVVEDATDIVLFEK